MKNSFLILMFAGLLSLPAIVQGSASAIAASGSTPRSVSVINQAPGGSGWNHTYSYGDSSNCKADYNTYMTNAQTWININKDAKNKANIDIQSRGTILNNACGVSYNPNGGPSCPLLSQQTSANQALWNSNIQPYKDSYTMFWVTVPANLAILNNALLDGANAWNLCI